MKAPGSAIGAGWSLGWRLRSHLSDDARRWVRTMTDPLSAPIGSIRGARTGDPLLALTFDDGPDPVHTPAILETLSRHGALATWFVLADKAEAHPELMQRILSEGHDVGLHGADHRRLTRVAGGDLDRHMADGVRRLKEVTGSTPRWFRPPYGSQSLKSFLAARRCGMDVVVWSADGADWEQESEADIARRAVDASCAGGILLLHDSLAADPNTPSALPNLDRGRIVELVLKGLGERALTAVSVSELLRDRRPHYTAWFRP